MADLKTKPSDDSVEKFLAGISDDQRRKDSVAVCRMMQEVTGEPAVMWGTSIVGFGSYHYKYATGREGDWLAVGFSPRKQNLTVYIMDGFEGYEELLDKLGKHSTGKSCLYIKGLDDVDAGALKRLVAESYKHVRATSHE